MSLYKRIFLEEGERWEAFKKKADEVARKAVPYAVGGVIGMSAGMPLSMDLRSRLDKQIQAREKHAQKYHPGWRVPTRPTPGTGADRVPTRPTPGTGAEPKAREIRAEPAVPSRTELILQKRARYKEERLRTRRENIRKWGHPEGELKHLPSGAVELRPRRQ